MIILHPESDIPKIQRSCKMVAQILSAIEKEVRPGVTTKYLDTMAEELAYEKGAIPGFKGYRGFPYSLCCSINSSVVHGFPSDRRLEKGDILSVDFGILYKGWYGDSALTVPVGEISRADIKLLNVTKACLYYAIELCYPGNRIGDLSFAIQTNAEKNGFSIVKEFTGHGIGMNLHEEPVILNYGKKGEGYLLKEGMFIAIEPIVASGSPSVEVLSDGWNTLTKDGSNVAHFEHSLAITKDGPIILTDRG